LPAKKSLNESPWVVDGLEIIKPQKPDQIAVGASGDFLLMHRQHWDELQGYPELPYNYGCDNYMLQKAGWLGLEQALLDIPYTIYHPDHGRPYDRRRPGIPLEKIFNEGPDLEIDGLFSPDWGLRGMDLPEKVLFD
jgi:hypothetical protein